MRFTTFFSAAALAVSAMAELNPGPLVPRDAAALEGVIEKLVSAMKALTVSVGDFNGDSIQVESDAAALSNSIDIGIQTITSGGPLDVNSLVSLQAGLTTLNQTGQELIQKTRAKKAQFAHAGLCTAVEDSILQVANQTRTMFHAVCAQLPAQYQPAVDKVGAAVYAVIVSAADDFSCEKCTNNPQATTTRALVPYPSETFSAIPLSLFTPHTRYETVQVTVTAPCTSTTPAFPIAPAPTTPVPVNPPVVGVSTSSTRTIPATVTPPAPTSTIPIAAGRRNSFGNAGLAAGVAIVAAMVL